MPVSAGGTDLSPHCTAARTVPLKRGGRDREGRLWAEQGVWRGLHPIKVGSRLQQNPNLYSKMILDRNQGATFDEKNRRKNLRRTTFMMKNWDEQGKI